MTSSSKIQETGFAFLELLCQSHKFNCIDTISSLHVAMVPFMCQIKCPPSNGTLDIIFACLFKVLIYQLFSPFLIFTNFSPPILFPQHSNIQDSSFQQTKPLNPMILKSKVLLFFLPTLNLSEMYLYQSIFQDVLQSLIFLTILPHYTITYLEGLCLCYLCVPGTMLGTWQESLIVSKLNQWMWMEVMNQNKNNFGLKENELKCY